MGKLGVFSVALPALPPGMDPTVLQTKEVDFTLTFTNSCKFLASMP